MHDIGFINVVQRPTKSMNEISDREYEAGIINLKHVIKQYEPKAICFVGINIYKRFKNLPIFRKIKLGSKQRYKYSDNKYTEVFVTPSTSSLGVTYSEEDKIRFVFLLKNALFPYFY
jgi:TDG/mug DNA glycosylase family protein